jgi:hypothetical protein
MIITLDTEGAAAAAAFLAYHQHGPDVLPGLVRDALLVAALSPPRAASLRIEVMRANVPFTSQQVALEVEGLPPGNYIAQAAENVRTLARSCNVTPEQAMHGAVRLGLAILAPPAHLLPSPPTVRSER